MPVSKFFIGSVFIFLITTIINVVDEILKPRFGGMMWQRIIRKSLYMTFGIIMATCLTFLSFE